MTIGEKIHSLTDKLTHKKTHATGSTTAGTADHTTGHHVGAADAASYQQTGTGMAGTNSMNTAAGTTGTAGTYETGAAHTTGAGGAVIDSERFTKTEDHEVLIEKKQYELEHRPVQKEYVVETRFVGEKQVPGAPREYVGSESHEVEERIKQAPAGDRTIVVENVDLPAGQVARNATTGTNATSGSY